MTIAAAASLLTACQDTGRSGDPLSNETYPAKGQFIQVDPPVGIIAATGERIQLTASVRDAFGKPVANPKILWQTMTPSVATVDWTGTVTGITEGLAEIKGTYGNISSTAVVAVAKPRLKDSGSGSVVIDPTADTVAVVGSSIKLLAVGRNPSGKLMSNKSLAWKSTDPAIANVDGEGVVTGLSSGSAEIIVENGQAADSATILVAPPGVPVAVLIEPEADTIPVIGSSLTLQARVLDGSGGTLSEKAVTWSTLDPTIAGVSSDGVVVGSAKGIARIRAEHQGFADTAQVWVAPLANATSLYVTPEADTIPQVGGTIQLTGTLVDGNGVPITGQTLSWGTMDAGVATVDANGTVKGVSKGLARITARFNTLVDTAMIWVAPAPTPTAPFAVIAEPARDTIAEVGGSIQLSARVLDASGNEYATVLPSWLSLDTAVAKVEGASTAVNTITVTGRSRGTARIVAQYGTASDTSVVDVDPVAGSSSTYRVALSPDPDSIAVNGGGTLTANLYLTSNGMLVEGLSTWTSLDPGIADVESPTASRTKVVKGKSLGTARIIATYNGVADTANVFVTATGGSGGGGSAGAGVTVSPSFASVLVGSSVTLSATAVDTLGNSISPSQLSWQSLDAAVASVTQTGLVQGLTPGTARIRVSWSTVADTATVAVNQPLPTGGATLTPTVLVPMLGPIVARGSSGLGGSISTYDNRYLQAEEARFQDYLKVENDAQGAYLLANHYGGLRGRLMWSIRNGEAWGPGVTDESAYAYARGVRIIRRYLQYSESNKFGIPAHNNTGLADIELLYRIEGDPNALMHIRCSAAAGTYDSWGYIDLTHPNNTAPRVPAISLQAINAAHRLGVPYTRCPANGNLIPDGSLASWREAGDRIVVWMDDYITAKAGVYGPGGLPASAHGGQEAYFMNAMLAVQLLDWYGYVNPDPRTLQLAQLIISHLIDMLAAKPGWETLGYETNSSGPAPDLAGFYVWPSLVLWQETGQQKYYDFAMKNLGATRTAYIDGMKQWNQVYSTLGQGTEALIMGAPWR